MRNTSGLKILDRFCIPDITASAAPAMAEFALGRAATVNGHGLAPSTVKSSN